MVRSWTIKKYENKVLHMKYVGASHDAENFSPDRAAFTLELPSTMVSFKVDNHSKLAIL